MSSAHARGTWELCSCAFARWVCPQHRARLRGGCARTHRARPRGGCARTHARARAVGVPAHTARLGGCWRSHAQDFSLRFSFWYRYGHLQRNTQSKMGGSAGFAGW